MKKTVASAWGASVAGALVLGLILGSVDARGASSEPLVAAEGQSVEIATAADLEAFVESGETLAAAEVSALTDGQLDQILEISDEAVASAQEAYAARSSRAEYAKAVSAYEQLSS